MIKNRMALAISSGGWRLRSMVTEPRWRAPATDAPVEWAGVLRTQRCYFDRCRSDEGSTSLNVQRFFVAFAADLGPSAAARHCQWLAVGCACSQSVRSRAISSISTAMSKGSSARPTALRV